MKKNRYLLCLLVTALLVFAALPRLEIGEGGLDGIFAASWLFFAFCAAAGNLSSLLYNSPMKRADRRNKKQKSMQMPKRMPG